MEAPDGNATRTPRHPRGNRRLRWQHPGAALGAAAGACHRRRGPCGAGLGEQRTGGVIATADDVDWHGIATAAVQEATAAEPDISVPITTEVVNAHPANALVEESSDADLLVVGSRGHGRVLKRVLGSVSDHCTHHAHCPVVVVPPPA